MYWQNYTLVIHLTNYFHPFIGKTIFFWTFAVPALPAKDGARSPFP